MKRDVIILTKSKKYNGYCVAGIDVDTGKWVRLAQPGRHSIEPKSFRYPNGKEPDLLDVVRVDIGDKCGTKLQPENVSLETVNILPVPGSDVEKPIEKRLQQDYDSHEHVYYNKYPKLLDKMLPKAAKETPFSLMLIEPKEIIFQKKSEEKIVANFKWKDVEYKDFRITDTEFINQACNQNTSSIFRTSNPVYLIISLGESFHNPQTDDIEYYKLIAGIIETRRVKDADIVNRTGIENKGSSTAGMQEEQIVMENKYEKAKAIIEKIACGYNPYTGEYIKGDSILNEQETIRSLFIATQALDMVIGGNNKNRKKPRKILFHLSEEQAGRIEYSNEPIPISRLVERINDVANTEDMKKLTYKPVVQWLLDNDYIVAKEINGSPVKQPTEKGLTLGLSMEERTSYGRPSYYVTLYNTTAQRFIVDNLNEMIVE